VAVGVQAHRRRPESTSQAEHAGSIPVIGSTRLRHRECLPIDWAFTDTSDDEPIECDRVAASDLADMVRRHEVLPGDRLGNAPWTELTEEGRRRITNMPPGDPESHG
jgi:hypothetical protein